MELKKNYPFHLLFVLFLLISSCSSSKHFRNRNYFIGSDFYNDTLNIHVKFFGDIKFLDQNKSNINKKLKDLKIFDVKDLLVYGEAVLPPEYELMLFFKEKEKTPENPTTQKITLILNDTVQHRVLYEKSFENQSVYLYLKAGNRLKTNKDLLTGGKQTINSVQFNYPVKKKLKYVEIFNKYKNEDNILFVVNKFKNAPILKNKQTDWMKFQFLSTILSKDTEYSQYKKLIEQREINKKEYLNKIIDRALNNKNRDWTSMDSAIDKIKKLSQNKNVIMLNEMHWHPKHRIFATKLLKPLKEEGYRYLAIEAVSTDKDSMLNKRLFPLKSTGYYTREPYFGIFIRKALEMGYQIVGYDVNTSDREKDQARNIKRIFEEDPTTKVFVYAGIDHILENNPPKKRMAEYFNELTGINPLTIDQVELAANLERDVALFKADVFPKDEKINSNVDFFLVNDINASLNKVYEEESIRNFTAEVEALEEYNNQEVFLSVYFLNEYSQYKSQSIPLVNRIIKPKKSEINLTLPIGSYQLNIWDKNDRLIISKKISVK